MKPLVLALLASSLPLATKVDMATPKLCAALEALRAAAATSGTPQRISVFKQEVWSVSCGHAPHDAAPTALCSAVADEVSMEFTHAFPWQIADCLWDAGVRPGLEQADLYTGLVNRKRIVHLTAGWRDGVRVDIRFVPTGDFGEFKDYWGRYDLVVWRP